MIYAKFEVLPNFDVKNMILSYAKDFSWEKWPSSFRSLSFTGTTNNK